MADSDSSPFVTHLKPWLREGSVIALVTLALYLLLALLTHDPGDPGFTHTGTHEGTRNLAGPVGAWLSDVLYSFFGLVAYFFPLMLISRAVSIIRQRSLPMETVADWGLVGVRVLGGLLLISTCATLLAMYSIFGSAPEAGGILGQELADAALGVFNPVGSTLLLLALLLLSISLATGISWSRVCDATGGITLVALQRAHVGLQWGLARLLGLMRTLKALGSGLWAEHLQPLLQRLRQRSETSSRVRPLPARQEPVMDDAAADPAAKPVRALRKSAKTKPVAPQEEAQAPVMIDSVKSGNLAFDFGEGSLPSLDLLDQPAPRRKDLGFSPQMLESLSEQVEQRLAEYGVEVTVTAVTPGPVVTRFEVQPAPGVKAARISSLARDLARSLAVVSVRVVEVIPGRSVVGIEIPNEHREMVRLRQVLDGPGYRKSHSPLTMALGFDIEGAPVVADLAKMPHLLVAGTTGSGKSVGVNAMLLSMLYKAGPDQLRMIMIDPKMLELNIYEDIPHLLTPVVTQMDEADNALRWCVAEMDRRYSLMSEFKVRQLESFNQKIEAAAQAGEPLRDPHWDPTQQLDPTAAPPALEKLPYIVVVVDEFADMMMMVGKKVEEKIARIAQKARAAGIHLILATQRPSVDVITGLIKANIPTRIAFLVSSKIDSRTILGEGGAEQLLGLGDMLYQPPGSNQSMRVHGAFVADEEVQRVVSDWKARGQPDYVEEVRQGGDSEYLPGIDPASAAPVDAEQDALYDKAVAFVTESRKASISSVQRALRIGYNRAATLVDAMEAAGVVSKAGHNGAREVLVAPAPRD